MLALYLTCYFFNFMLLHYFLKYSGNRDSKEQLSLAKGGSFSCTAVFSMAHLAKCTHLKKQQEVHPRGADTVNSTSPCSGSLALVSAGQYHWITGCRWEVCCMPENHEQHGCCPGKKEPLFLTKKLMHSQEGHSEFYSSCSTNQGYKTFGLRVQARQMDCQSHPKYVSMQVVFSCSSRNH